MTENEHLVELIVATDERTKSRITNPDGIQNELASHLERLGARVHAIAVRRVHGTEEGEARR